MYNLKQKKALKRPVPLGESLTERRFQAEKSSSGHREKITLEPDCNPVQTVIL